MSDPHEVFADLDDYQLGAMADDEAARFEPLSDS